MELMFFIVAVCCWFEFVTEGGVDGTRVFPVLLNGAYTVRAFSGSQAAPPASGLGCEISREGTSQDS